MIKYIVNNNEPLCLEAVKHNGLLLEYINYRNKTEQICLEAVKQNGLALEYVENQTEQICLEAIKNTVEALKFVNINSLKIFNDLDLVNNIVDREKIINVRKFIEEMEKHQIMHIIMILIKDCLK